MRVKRRVKSRVSGLDTTDQTHELDTTDQTHDRMSLSASRVNAVLTHARMDLETGSFVRINEHSRNKVLRGLIGRVHDVGCRGPIAYCQVGVLGLDEHVQGSAPLWWMPAVVLTPLGVDDVDPMEAEEAARTFLPFMFGRWRHSTATIEASVAIEPPTYA